MMRKTIAVTIDLETDWGGKQEANGTNYGMEFALPRITKMLDKRNIKATFFVCGDILENYNNDVLALLDNGHEIQCHGYHHVDHSLLSTATLKKEIEACMKTFSRFGIKPVGFRAPQGKFKDNMFGVLSSLGFKYDSSVIRAWIPGRLDNRGHPIQPFDVETKTGKIREIPISPIPRLNLPFGLLWINTMGMGVFKKLAKGMPEQAVFYMHPFDIIHPKPPFSTSMLNRGWYSFRQDNAEKTLVGAINFFAKTNDFVTLHDML